jgi:hypothetical protein
MAAPSPTEPQASGAIPAFLGTAAASPRRASTAGSPPSRKKSPAGTSTPLSAETARPRLDPGSLPLPGLSRRRLLTVAGLVAAAWLVLAFGRQVGEASAASNRADDLRAANAAMRQDVATLQVDLARVQDDRFILQQGRQFGLGGPAEIPFTLAAGAPPLSADAPGSAAVRLGADQDRRSPLEVWLSILFGG